MPFVKFTIRQLLVATFLVAIGLAALLIDTREPYGIVVASMAFSYAVTMLVWRSFRSERMVLFVQVALMLPLMVLFGAVFAILVR